MLLTPASRAASKEGRVFSRRRPRAPRCPCRSRHADMELRRAAAQEQCAGHKKTSRRKENSARHQEKEVVELRKACKYPNPHSILFTDAYKSRIIRVTLGVFPSQAANGETKPHL